MGGVSSGDSGGDGRRPTAAASESEAGDASANATPKAAAVGSVSGGDGGSDGRRPTAAASESEASDTSANATPKAVAVGSARVAATAGRAARGMRGRVRRAAQCGTRAPRPR